MTIVKENGLAFSQMSLNRASSSRKNTAWLTEQRNDENTTFVPIWRSKYLFENDNVIELSNASPLYKKVIELALEVLFLGLDDEQAVFIVDLSQLPEDQLLALFMNNENVEQSVVVKDLRVCLPLLPKKSAPILAYGKALSYWHINHQYCGFCGHKSTACDGGHMRKCMDESCHRESFPRTDPVVIMLVEYQPENGPAKCLLAQHHSIKSQVVSTLAGFVDPGESLEEAVVREVQEEAGIEVGEVTYMASQPWAFPSSVMVGFYAKAKSPVLNIDNDEIVDAHWFTAEEISTFGEWGDEGDNFQLPRQESIARYLIDHWLEKT